VSKHVLTDLSLIVLLSSNSNDQHILRGVVTQSNKTHLTERA